MSQPTFDSNGKRYWLPHEEQRLKELKRARRSWSEIATTLKRTPKSCVEKWQYINPTVPPDVNPEPAFDEGHVAACLAEGGFAEARVINGETVWIYPGRAA